MTELGTVLALVYDLRIPDMPKRVIRNLLFYTNICRHVSLTLLNNIEMVLNFISSAILANKKLEFLNIHPEHQKLHSLVTVLCMMVVSN